VLCQAFNKGSAEECTGCYLNIRYVNETEADCVYDDDGCLTVFNFEKDLSGGNDTVLVIKERSKSSYILMSYSTIQNVTSFLSTPPNPIPIPSRRWLT